MTQKQVSLFYSEGSSDKIYQVMLQTSGAGYTVNFAFGRRGATLNTGTKTSAPVSLADAEKIFDKLVREKKAKGYTEAPSGQPYKATSKEERTTDLHAQLLNPITNAQLEWYLDNDEYGIQEKFDGERVLLKIAPDKVTAINRNGLVRDVPEYFQNLTEIAKLHGVCVIDGELVHDGYVAFDVLVHGGDDIRSYPYSERCAVLVLVAGDRLTVAPLVIGAQAKRRFHDKIVKARKEGVVFKKLSATYKAGRPSSGGSQMKYKLTEEVTCLVSAINNARRSVQLQCARAGFGNVNIGSCAIPVNKALPKIGDLVEVRYLYCFPKSGHLYQPVFKDVRTDKTRPDEYDSLKFTTKVTK